MLKPDHTLASGVLLLFFFFIHMPFKAICAHLKQFGKPTSICESKCCQCASIQYASIEALWLKNHRLRWMMGMSQDPLSKSSRWSKETTTLCGKSLGNAKRSSQRESL